MSLCLRFHRLPDSRGAEVREYGKLEASDINVSLVARTRPPVR